MEFIIAECDKVYLILHYSLLESLLKSPTLRFGRGSCWATSL